MSDPISDDKPTPDAAQPFQYAPPSGDKLRIVAATSGAQAFQGRDLARETASEDQAAQKAYERGVLEGRAAARAEFEKTAADLRGQISEAVRNFSRDRADYFGRVEPEVVRLSLSVAQKILHRESQMDPMVLTGVVHVALQKINRETRVRLRTHPDEARFWSDYFQHAKDNYPPVDVVGDPSLAQGHCTLETDFGTTEISLDTQLKEIEQGFFDLLEQRPKGQA
jgi:flagellar assembly protein FliH